MSDKKARRKILESMRSKPTEHERLIMKKEAEARKFKEGFKEMGSVYSDRIRDYDRRIKEADSQKEKDKLIEKKKKLEKKAHSDPSMKEEGLQSDKSYDLKDLWDERHHSGSHPTDHELKKKKKK